LTQRLILFAKRPIAGLAKTRLVPVLGQDGALALYRAMLHDALTTVAALARPGRRVEVAFDRPWTPEPSFATECAALEVRSQGSGDLGRRLLGALRRSYADGSRATVFLGADSPTLAPERIEAAFGALERGADVVVGPASDGGYVLIGASRPIDAPFSDIPWGASEVLERTHERARSAGLHVVDVPGGDDVDDASDVARLVLETTDPNVRARCPWTAKWCDNYRDGRRRA
jgi:rSAM/selenodomain-associated transferase 1